MAIMSRVTLLVRKYKRSFDLLISSCDNLSYFSLVGGGGENTILGPKNQTSFHQFAFAFESL